MPMETAVRHIAAFALFDLGHSADRKFLHDLFAAGERHGFDLCHRKQALLIAQEQQILRRDIFLTAVVCLIRIAAQSKTPRVAGV